MKTLDLIGTAVSNTFRSKTRTILTILAIFIGAFTLTITNGLGTGINQYIDATVASFGASDVMTVTKNATETTTDGLQEYDPDAVTTARGPATSTIQVITADDLDTLAGIDGVERVEPVRSVSLDYIQYDGGTKYVVSTGSLVSGQTLQLSAGTQPSETAGGYQLAVPTAVAEALGFASDSDAVGATITLALTDGTGAQQTVTATISGVTDAGISLGGASAAITPSEALTQQLYSLQQEGVAASQQDRYTQARVWFDPNATTADVSALQSRLTAAGFTGTTLADQLGTFTTVIDGIVLVLNVFAIIALLAASFGIVNTLLMSVQERTREIGLMKAMGMGSGRVFSLFSLEATFIGFLGSAIGVGVAMVVGTVVSSALARSFLANLPRLHLIAFDPASIAVTILVVMAIAFLAGTLPAARAARADPVESLRYE